MEPRLTLESLTYDGIGNFIASAVEESQDVPLYLLGKAAAYVDIALALGSIFPMEAMELRTVIVVYAGILDPAPLVAERLYNMTSPKAPQSPVKRR